MNNEIKAEKTEIVLGLVAPIGVDLSKFENLFKTVLKNYRYLLNVIKVSDFLKSLDAKKITGLEVDETTNFKRYESLMNVGTEIRDLRNMSFLADVSISKIAVKRDRDEDKNPKPYKGKIHIIHSIKHKKEVEILREVYGNGFFLIGVFGKKRDRIRHLIEKLISEEDATRLIIRDNDENKKHGQQVSKVFELSDVFINLNLDNLEDTKRQIDRFLELLFGNPFLTPTKDENAMFLAYSSSLRSGSLARQVGAVITNKTGDVISTGTNDVPRYGGGQYWTNDKGDSRDFQRGFDPNTRQRNQILKELFYKVCENSKLLLEKHKKGKENDKLKFKSYDKNDILEVSKQLFANTSLFDLTEFGRDVHAEMEAIISCARIGQSVRGGTLYCTTFPCHNCAKHIINAGINRVVYVEAYPKSKAKELHSDSLEIEEDSDTKVVFESFMGIAARRFFDLFSLSVGTGLSKKRKDDDGKKLEWHKSESFPRFQMVPTSYLDRESRIADEIKQVLKGEK